MPLTHDIGVRIPYPLLQNASSELMKRFFMPFRHPNHATLHSQPPHLPSHPINHGETEKNIYLLGIENTGLLALARLILPQKLLDNFEEVRINEKTI